MKKLLLLLTLTLTITTSAQYAIVSAVDLNEGAEDDYIKTEKFWGPLHKKAIEDASTDLKEAIKGTDTEEIKKKTETLVQASMKLGEAIYKSQEKKEGSPKEGDKNDEGKTTARIHLRPSKNIKNQIIKLVHDLGYLNSNIVKISISLDIEKIVSSFCVTRFEITHRILKKK